jgi:hypothetical protein
VGRRFCGVMERSFDRANRAATAKETASRERDRQANATAASIKKMFYKTSAVTLAAAM